MSFKRATRVADLIMADISDILLREIRDPRIKLVTITGVNLTDDLRLAKIFFCRDGQRYLRSSNQNSPGKSNRFLKEGAGEKAKTALCAGYYFRVRRIVRIRKPNR